MRKKLSKKKLQRQFQKMLQSHGVLQVNLRESRTLRKLSLDISNQ